MTAVRSASEEVVAEEAGQRQAEPVVDEFRESVVDRGEAIVDESVDGVDGVERHVAHAVHGVHRYVRYVLEGGVRHTSHNSTYCVACRLYGN